MMTSLRILLLGLATYASAESISPDTGVVTKVVYAAGEGHPGTQLVQGTISVVPGVEYVVALDVLRNDLGNGNTGDGNQEWVSSITVDGQSMGGCEPDGGDYACTFFSCPVTPITVTSQSGTVSVDMTFKGHSNDCDCDMTTWQCDSEHQTAFAGLTAMQAVGKFTLTPVGTITKVIATSGSTAVASNTGTITVVPGVEYSVSVDILRNDLEASSERVSSITLDGQQVGACNPDGDDYDCTFFNCPIAPFTITSATGIINVDMTFQGHSRDCDCDTQSWDCKREASSVPSYMTMMTAVGRFTLVPVPTPSPTGAPTTTPTGAPTTTPTGAPTTTPTGAPTTTPTGTPTTTPTGTPTTTPTGNPTTTPTTTPTGTPTTTPTGNPTGSPTAGAFTPSAASVQAGSASFSVIEAAVDGDKVYKCQDGLCYESIKGNRKKMSHVKDTTSLAGDLITTTATTSDGTWTLSDDAMTLSFKGNDGVKFTFPASCDCA